MICTCTVHYFNDDQVFFSKINMSSRAPFSRPIQAPKLPWSITLLTGLVMAHWEKQQHKNVAK